MNKVYFFSADYRDGMVYMADKKYQAGTFVIQYLNQYYVKDTAARITVFTGNLHFIEKSMNLGYINESDFISYGQTLTNAFDALSKIVPFKLLNVESEHNRVDSLFTEDNCNKLLDYYQMLSKVHSMNWSQRNYHYLPADVDEALLLEYKALHDEVLETVKYYTQLGKDIVKIHTDLLSFINGEDTVEKFDENHLLPLAMKAFDVKPFEITTEFVKIKKAGDSTGETLAKRYYFKSLYSFILTDLFEGLHYGHYPKCCKICGKYFLMDSARKQQYCNGYAPIKVNGSKITCRKYAAMINRKESASANPINDIYTRRCSAIRTEIHRGTITKEFGEMAKSIAKDCKFKAIQDNDYANKQYLLDMGRDNLYKTTKTKLIE